MFDFGGVVDPYCTIYVGDPPAEYREAYEVMPATQDAGARSLNRHPRYVVGTAASG